MKRLLLIIGLLSLFQTGTPSETSLGSDTNQGTSYVWICTGPGAVAYHSKRNCGGLNNCRDDIISVTLHDAITKWRRRECRRCY